MKKLLLLLLLPTLLLADAVIFSGNDVKALKQNLNLFDVTKILSGSLNPSAGSGVVAPKGSLYLSTDGSAYSKVGSADTAWAHVDVGGAGAGQLTYIFSSNNSSIPGYKQAVSINSFVPNALATLSATVTTSPTLIATFATNSGFPNVTTIPVGFFLSHYETQKASGSNNYHTFFEVYERDLLGTETLIATSDNTSATALNTIVQNNPVAIITSPISTLATDRIIVKIYGQMSASSASVSVRYDDNTDARLELPSATVDATNFVPYIGATKDIDLGSTHTIVNVVDPTNAQDVATKNYIDNELTNYVPYVGAAADINLGNTQKVINSPDPSAPQDVATKNYIDTAYVPYSGATSSVDLGNYSLTASTVRFKDPAYPGQSGYIDLNNSTYTLRDVSGFATNLLVNDIGANNGTYNTLSANSATITQLNDLSLNASILPDSRQLKFASGDVALDWGNTALMNYGVQIYNWTTGLFYNGLGYTADVMNGYLMDPNSAQNSVEWFNRYLKDASGVLRYDWNNGEIFNEYGNKIIEANGYQSRLNSVNGSLSVDSQTRSLYDSSLAVSQNWESRTLNNSAGLAVANWENGALLDDSGFDSILWTDRTMAGTNGTAFVDYSTPNQLKVIGSMSLMGSSFISPASKLQLDSGTSTASYLKFTAGTTTGQTSADGFDIGISSTGAAQINQRENSSIEFLTNNASRMTLTNIQLTSTVPWQGPSGTAGAPSITFSGDSNTGLYNIGADTLGITTGGTERMRIGSTGNVGIGGSPDANAILDIQSTTKAFMPPRMTTAQKNAIASPAAGMVVYDTDLKAISYYNGTAWLSSGALSVTSKTANYTALVSDDVILASSSGGAITITLPTAVGFTGKTFTIKKTDSSGNAVTIGTTSSQTIDGSTTFPINVQYRAINVVSDGSNWHTL